MSFSTMKIEGAKEDLIVDIPATDDVGASAGPTIESNLTGNAGATNPNKLYWAQIDCTDNTVEDGTLRLYDSSTTPTVGSTAAHVWLPGKRGRTISYHFPAGIPWTANQYVYAAYVKGQGGTGGSSAPSGTVKVKLGFKIGS